MNGLRCLALVIVAMSVCSGSSLFQAQDAGRDQYVAFGDTADEAFHNLRGWGQVNPGLLPEGTDLQRKSRYQMLRGLNSVDLFVTFIRIPYVLTFRTEDGICDDSFDVYVNGRGPVYRYRHGSLRERFPVHSVEIDRALISTSMVTVAFQNVASDSCGLAAVYFVKLEPGHTIVTASVKGIVDGDTLLLVDDSQVRLIGVDTPEVEPLDRMKDISVWCVNAGDVWPMAREARDFVNEWLGHLSAGKSIDIVLEIREAQRFDNQNRLLAYVYRASAAGGINQSLNGELLRNGYSKTFLRDYGNSQDFVNISADDARALTQLQQHASARYQGFWGPYKPRYITTWNGLAWNWSARCAPVPGAVR